MVYRKIVVQGPIQNHDEAMGKNCLWCGKISDGTPFWGVHQEVNATPTEIAYAILTGHIVTQGIDIIEVEKW